MQKKKSLLWFLYIYSWSAFVLVIIQYLVMVSRINKTNLYTVYKYNCDQCIDPPCLVKCSGQGGGFVSCSPKYIIKKNISANSNPNSKIFQGVNQVPYGVDYWKNQRSTISCYCPFNRFMQIFPTYLISGSLVIYVPLAYIRTVLYVLHRFMQIFQAYLITGRLRMVRDFLFLTILRDC
jgi:hypothetical protein